MKQPLILISNDDGYQAKGIHALVEMIHDLGDIIVCAPEGARSGKSRAFSMTDLSLREITDHDYLPDTPSQNLRIYACSGTPVDCIKIACGTVCERKPDLIIGGINHGDNASTNAHYSGTCGIAFEGTIKGIPSIAFSLCDYDLDADFEPMRDIVRTKCQEVLRDGLPHSTFLNINVPKVADASELKGTRICRMADGVWLNEVETIEGKTDEYGNPLYQLKGYFHNNEPEAEDTDAWAIANGYIAVTPSTIDVTAHS